MIMAPVQEDALTEEEALAIAKACQQGKGSDNAVLLTVAVLKLIRSRGPCEELIGLIGHLYSVTVENVSRSSDADGISI